MRRKDALRKIVFGDHVASIVAEHQLQIVPRISLACGHESISNTYETEHVKSGPHVDLARKMLDMVAHQVQASGIPGARRKARWTVITVRRMTKCTQCSMMESNLELVVRVEVDGVHVGRRYLL